MSITHKICRGDDEIEIEATGRFYYGELDSWTWSRLDETKNADLQLTQEECDDIMQKLIEDNADDWNEDGWKAERDRS